MQKSLFAAALVGAATAYTGTGFEYELNPVTSKWFSLAITMNADAGYTTGYMGSSASAGSESYGFEVYSYANLMFEMEYFETYKHHYMFTFIPLNIVPYTQTVSWMRPEAKNGQSVDATGSRDITLLKFYTTYTENTKTCGASILDAIMDADMSELKPTCAYDATTETSYVDTYWTYEPLADMALSWYGEADWFTKTLFSKSA